MRQVIKAYSKAHDTDKETAYIFIYPKPKSGESKLGYMPKKRSYGFVFSQFRSRTQIAQAIAHELGHGLFRLEHSFETYPSLSKGSTDNLMDYSTGNRLHKYQWDLIHNPIAMLGWFQDEEESAYYTNPYTYLWKEINTFTNSLNYSLYEFNQWVAESKRSILSLFGFSDVELVSDQEKVQEILAAIKEDKIEVLTNYAAEEIITAQNLKLSEATYDKLIIYFLQAPKAIDTKNYKIEDNAKEGYSLLILTEEGKASKDVVRVQVTSKQKQTLETYLFGKEKPITENSDCPSNFCCTKCGKDLTVTLERLKEIYDGNVSITQDQATHFNEALRNGGFSTCKQLSHFFSQSIIESKNFTDFSEGYRYRLKSIYDTFGGQTGNNSYATIYSQNFWDDEIYLNYVGSSLCEHLYKKKENNTTSQSFKASAETSKKSRNVSGIKHEIEFPKSFSNNSEGNYMKATINNASQKGEKLFNLVYENKNGNNQVGDGWKYRGRGVIQVTGRGNYRNASNKVNEVFINKSFDWEANPEDLAIDNESIIYSAVGWFLNNFNPITSLDLKTSKQVTLIVNTKMLEADKREIEFNRLMNDESLYKCNED